MNGKIYAQIINNSVNMIGGENEGLPLPQHFLDENPHILNVDITDFEQKPQINDMYENGIFIPFERWAAENPPPKIEPPVTMEEIKELLLVTMCALAETEGEA